MADTRAIVSTVLYCLWWPTSKIIYAIQTILSPFWTILQFVFLPLTYLLHAVLSIILFPFRHHILDRIETIYIWLGIAGLIGCMSGAAIFLIFKVLTSALNIDGAAESKARAEGRTIIEYRAARREKEEASAEISLGPAVVRLAGPRRRGLTSQAIMEEESEF
ncbi:hypothetical protein K458DRAFT_311254 [Lentithecium fluviatile CBS 122367]|uniref:Uncharacterized protein n=1 Tax=Lentithecium fluviatile CBS 122367 TaxID=1168545 RepID=A0A6G1IQP2_9PLEO|nr:hypothetical protein K458DRAFT_311254 [Lentithecium fluviatile CBS 122367]